METQDERLVQSNEGNGSADSASTLPECQDACGPECGNITTVPVKIQDETVVGDKVQERKPPEGYETVPPELWPDENGKQPELTPKLLKQLRGKYFTIKHPQLKECGHKLDMINEPRHRNCENCWWTFFNTHPQLVETADQFFKTQGKQAMIGLRGKQFVTMFVRFMATMIHFARQEGRLPNGSDNQQPSGEGQPDGAEVARVGSGVITE